MNKGVCVLCGVVVLVAVSLVEGAPLLCHDCEKKKQPHIETREVGVVGQPIGTANIAGISGYSGATGPAAPSPSPAPESEA